SRQRSFRSLVCAHVVLAAIGAVVLGLRPGTASALIVGNLLLVAGIVEGALMIGWRLAQLPKSQALEFLLVSPLRPAKVFLAEAAVGIARLGLVTLSGLPVLAMLVLEGLVAAADLWPLLLSPFVWGTFTGLGLTTWAYEPVSVRRWGERIVLLLMILYLLVGVLAGGHFRALLLRLPPPPTPPPLFPSLSL